MTAAVAARHIGHQLRYAAYRSIRSNITYTRPSMNLFFTLRVLERMHGRTFTSVLAAATEGTVGEVCEKTMRNWFRKRTTPAPETLALLVAGGRQKMDEALKDWPLEERQACADLFSRCAGVTSSVIASLQNRVDDYPAAIELANQVDRLEVLLDDHKDKGDREAWIRTFLEAEWIQDEHLTCPYLAASADETRQMVRDAKTWEDLNVPMAVFVLNVQFQLLATLDLEFGARYLDTFEATPIFASLLPRLNPRAPTSADDVRPIRDKYHYPTRRLLDAIACMRMYRASHGRKWPATVPSVKKMGIWLAEARRGELTLNLSRWRSGRTLTLARFVDIWNACFDFMPKAERPFAPEVMFYAATVFTEIFVKGNRKKPSPPFSAPDPAFYQQWWEIQHRKLTAGTEPLRFGTCKWMPALV
jgi:hypothetical protein